MLSSNETDQQETIEIADVSSSTTDDADELNGLAGPSNAKKDSHGKKREYASIEK